MPGKSNSEKIDDLTARVLRMSADLDNIEEKYWTQSESLVEDIRRLKADLHAVQRDNAVLQQRCMQLEKQHDEADRRRWQMMLAILTGLFTAVVALIVALSKK